MNKQRLVKMTAQTLSTLCLTAATAGLGQAQESLPDAEAARIKIGFEIAPVPLKLEGKDPGLVGLGSYWVNGVSDCNFCHTSGAPPNFNFAAGFNPYFGQRKKTDPTTYLAGGSDFGPAVPPIPGVYPPAAYWLASGPYVGPDIIARNLTPDKTGRAEGGRTYEEFRAAFKHGADLDQIHLTCTEPPGDPTTASCIPPPVDGSLLQVMPWPNFQDLTERDVRAIYEYLSAIPCIDNSTSAPPTGAPNELRNDCGGEPQARGAVSSAPMRHGTQK
jgi:hypothetical protein